jgi:hypothetical protein
MAEIFIWSQFLERNSGEYNKVFQDTFHAQQFHCIQRSLCGSEPGFEPGYGCYEVAE